MDALGLILTCPNFVATDKHFLVLEVKLDYENMVTLVDLSGLDMIKWGDCPEVDEDSILNILLNEDTFGAQNREQRSLK